ncbi:hypothetical protein GCM10010168_16650 [Actinoplanes ianthinogenes]|uniref:Uncharacterized protein n=1 Tax=Actinoplanes ianthinogenes TaxID=122358 RepID=A0ABN6CHD7_9ACTN|nr:hypothetical protein [Actinoplanes ianthinogenes]BCJ44852.1 hypothetical protein Aiant_55090 [Actinoplanes ianthinogenes]GGR00376.1 hypothetical protein GCM10010168_16650 [Actinoplanes ianthinogenes]
MTVVRRVVAGRVEKYRLIKIKFFIYARPLGYGSHAPARAGHGDLAAGASRAIAAPFILRGWSRSTPTPAPTPRLPATGRLPVVSEPQFAARHNYSRHVPAPDAERPPSRPAPLFLPSRAALYR